MKYKIKITDVYEGTIEIDVDSEKTALFLAGVEFNIQKKSRDNSVVSCTRTKEVVSREVVSRGCCNECGYKADYIIDNNNYADNGYKDLDQVPKDKMLCGACYEADSVKEGSK